MGTVFNLHVAYERFKTYYQFLEKELDKYHYRMTGMGVSPMAFIMIIMHCRAKVPYDSASFRVLCGASTI